MPYKAVIRGVSHAVPPRRVDNHELSKLMDTSDEWITERTGIKERRFVEPGTSTSQLAMQAATELLQREGLKPSDIDYVVASTLSPDMYFPGIGVLVQHGLGIAHVPCLDVRAQCSGLVYGLSVIDGLIQSGQAKRILFVCAEVQSPVLDLSNRGREMAVLFGDGAGAMIVEAEEASSLPRGDNQERGIIGSLLGADGSGATVLCMKGPGTGTPGFITREDFEAGLYHPHMEGRVVFKNAVTRMCEVAETLLTRYRISPESVDLLIPHQANLRINETVREKLGVPPEKVFNNIQHYGNTTSATIPICMSEACQAGKLKKGNLVMTLAFGAGFTWGGNLIRW